MYINNQTEIYLSYQKNGGGLMNRNILCLFINLHKMWFLSLLAVTVLMFCLVMKIMKPVLMFAPTSLTHEVYRCMWTHQTHLYAAYSSHTRKHLKSLTWWSPWSWPAAHTTGSSCGGTPPPSSPSACRRWPTRWGGTPRWPGSCHSRCSAGGASGLQWRH